MDGAALLQQKHLAKPPQLEIIFLSPSPPWSETFQVAFLWECMASGQSDSREREKMFDISTK